MDDLLQFLRARNEDDDPAYAYVAHTFGGEALLDSHLPMLDLIGMLARDHKAMDPSAPPGSALPTRFACSRSPTPTTPTTGRHGVPSAASRTVRPSAMRRPGIRLGVVVAGASVAWRVGRHAIAVGGASSTNPSRRFIPMAGAWPG
jgi:hypothetical protein